MSTGKYNKAVAIMSLFVSAIFARVARYVEIRQQGHSETYTPPGVGHSQGRKKHVQHNSAGTKIARQARNGACTLRGRVALTD